MSEMLWLKKSVIIAIPFTGQTSRNNDENVGLSRPSSIFSPQLKFFLRIFGLHLGTTRQRCDNALFAIFLIRLTTLVIFEVQYSLKFKWIEFLFNLFVFVLPIYGFSHLFLNLCKFIELFDASCGKVCSLYSTESASDHMNRVRRVNFVCVMAVLIHLFFAYFIGLSVIFVTDSWVIRRTIPMKDFNPTFERTIALIAYIYEAVCLNYVPISIALYLAYYECLMIFKKIILTRVSSFNGQRCLFRALDHLDEMINIFESYLSLLPFNWLFYCINPSLCSVLALAASDRVAGENTLEVWMNMFFQLSNVIITLGALARITHTQEVHDASVDRIIQSMLENVTSPLHLTMIHRTKQVLSRPVTIWHIHAIDRSNILSFISSAITFSTLLFQLLK